MTKKLILWLLVMSTSTIVFADSPNQKPMVYRYWDWSLTNSRDNYQIAALELALEKTFQEYGAYEIIRIQQAFTNARVIREIKSGELINLHAAPAYSPSHKHTAYVNDIATAIEVPLMEGLLGYRQLIVPQNKLENFQHIATADELRERVAGQGQAWEDVYIYRHNGFKVNDDGDYTSLVNMLLAGRFDYLPMSIIEVHNVIAQAADPSQLTLVDNLIIYYPLPLYFYVSKQHPSLAIRLDKGLRIAQADGSLQKLLHEHFNKEITLLRNKKTQLIVMENPAVPESLGLSQPLLINASSPQ